MHILEDFIQRIGKLPGLGPRSARRIALHLLKNKEEKLRPLTRALNAVYEQVQTCTVCFNVDICSPCTLCNHFERVNGLLCVVADVADLWAMERARMFFGKYHVLGGLLSAVEGTTPEKLTLDALRRRIATESIREIIFALSATIDGQTTMHYVMAELQEFPLNFTSLAHGVPLGGELDYLDDGTLTLAYKARQAV